MWHPNATFNSLHTATKWCGKEENISLKEMATCMIEARDLRPNLWAEAINCAAHIHNIAFHISVKGKPPYEAWFGHKPNVSNFKIFGSRAWA